MNKVEVFENFWISGFIKGSKHNGTLLQKDLLSQLDYFCNSMPSGVKVKSKKTGEFKYHTTILGDCIVSDKREILKFDNYADAFNKSLEFKRYVLDLRNEMQEFLGDCKRHVYQHKIEALVKP